MTKRFYCRLCWQEFDDPKRDHNKGSWFGNQRLDRDCPGDIHPTTGRVPQSRIKRESPPPLEFTGEGIKIV